MFRSLWCRWIFRYVIASNSRNLVHGSLCSRFYSSSGRVVNYYDALGITPKATQNDIKAAYYKLSMMYHPDKNKGSDTAAQKFRDITEAYEVLGNFKLRKLYDKGIIHTAGPQYSQTAVVEEEDDAQTKFYKSRMKRSEVPNASGRTPIYDFDEWSKAHYGASFERRKAAKARYERKEEMNRSHALAIQNEFVIFSLVACVIIFLIITVREASHDVNHIKEKKEN